MAPSPLRNCKSKVLAYRAPQGATIRLAATGDGGLRSNGLPGKYAGQTLGRRHKIKLGGKVWRLPRYGTAEVLKKPRY